MGPIWFIPSNRKRQKSSALASMDIKVDKKRSCFEFRVVHVIKPRSKEYNRLNVK